MLFCTCYGFVSVLHSILLFKVNFKLEMPFLKIKKYLFSLYSSMQMDANFENTVFFYGARAGIQTLLCVISRTQNRTVVIVIFPPV